MDQKNDSIFCAFSPEVFVLLATLLGLLLACVLDANEQDSFGNFLATIGQALQTTASQAELLKNDCNNNKTLDKINDMKQQLCNLENEIRGRR